MAKRLCPWWLGYLLACPLRRFGHNPDKILGPHLREGMTVLDVGCGMGFFTLPLAKRVGSSGKVVAVDLQERMLRSLRLRAIKAGLSERIETRVCGQDNLAIGDLTGKVDFALAFAVVHEIPDPAAFFSEIRRALRPGGRLLFAEPIGHVKKGSFEESVKLAAQAGFTVVDRPRITHSHAVLLQG